MPGGASWNGSTIGHELLVFPGSSRCASVVLARPQFEYDSGYLVKLIAEQRITAACFVPSLLRSMTRTSSFPPSGINRRDQRLLLTANQRRHTAHVLKTSFALLRWYASCAANVTTSD